MFLENTIDEGDGEERIVWEHEGVTFIVLREDRKTEHGQTGRGDNGNKQRDGEKLVLEVQTQICE